MKTNLLLALLFFSLAISSHAQTIPQEKSGTVSGTTGTATFSSSVTPGDVIAVFFSAFPTSGTPSFGVTDNNSDTYAQAAYSFSSTGGLFGPQAVAIWYSCNVVNTPHAAPTVTATDTLSDWSFTIRELHNVQATGCLDQTNNLASLPVITGSTGTWTSASITPTVASSLALSYIQDFNCTTIGTPSGWTHTTLTSVTVYQNLSSTAPVSAVYPITSVSGCTSKWVGVIVNFPNSVQPTRAKIRVTQDGT